MSTTIPNYVPGHNLLAGKSVLITAAAGAGIGFAAAQKSVEEGARALVISDVHEGRLAQAVETLQAINPECTVSGKLCNVTVEDDVQALIQHAEDATGGVEDRKSVV